MNVNREIVMQLFFVFIKLLFDLVDRYGISVSEMTTDMFHLS